jgi:hypothetical protein
VLCDHNILVFHLDKLFVNGKVSEALKNDILNDVNNTGDGHNNHSTSANSFCRLMLRKFGRAGLIFAVTY